MLLDHLVQLLLRQRDNRELSELRVSNYGLLSLELLMHSMELALRIWLGYGLAIGGWSRVDIDEQRDEGRLGKFLRCVLLLAKKPIIVVGEFCPVRAALTGRYRVKSFRS